MRGERTNIAKTRVDLVLVAAHYERGSERLIFARGHARRGQVWTDVKLYDRATLVADLEKGRQIVTGRNTSLSGDFEILSPVHFGPDQQLLAGGGSQRDGDDLGLPIL